MILRSSSEIELFGGYMVFTKNQNSTDWPQFLRWNFFAETS